MTGNGIMWIVMIILLGMWGYMMFGKIKGVQSVNAEQFAKEMEKQRDFLLIDVREPHEFRRGHIRGARNIPLSQLPEQLSSVTTDKRILLYCQSGVRSRQAAKFLSQKGFTNIVNLRGGIMSWHGERVS